MRIVVMYISADFGTLPRCCFMDLQGSCRPRVELELCACVLYLEKESATEGENTLIFQL